MTDYVYTPHIPQEGFIFEGSLQGFRKTFQNALEHMWDQFPAFNGKILTGADPVFNLVTTQDVAQAIMQSPFPRQLNHRTAQEFGMLYSTKLEWDDVHPNQLPPHTHVLPSGTSLVTPRPRIACLAIHLTQQQAADIGLPGYPKLR